MATEHKPKILIVHNYYQIPGGEDTVVANEKKLLEENGHEVILYTRNNSELKYMGKLRKILLPLTTIFNPRTYRDVKRIISEENIEIVHVHNTLNLISPSVYYAAVKKNVPVVQTLHNFRFLCPGATFYRDGHICEDCTSKGMKCAIQHKCYRNSHLLTLMCVINTWIHRQTGILKKINYIALTNFTKEKFIQNIIFKKDKIFIKPNFTQEPSSNEYQKTERFLFVGRIEEIKGLRLLVDAFRECPKYNLDIIGTGSLEEEIKKTIENERIDNIHLLGYIPHDALSRYIKQAKALVMCSQWYETFGMVIIEAYSCKTPALVGRIGNIKDLVTEGETGYTFVYDSKEDLIEKIQMIMGTETNDMGNFAYELFKEKYTGSANYIQLMSIYSSVLSSSKQKEKG